MMSLSLFSFIVCSLFLFRSDNPVKMSFLLVIFSLLSFLLMFFLIGESWFPLIFSLLFIGGIMVIFMVISSLFSNEKIDKYSFFGVYFCFFAISLLFFVPSYSSLFVLEGKSFLVSGFNFVFMIFLVLGYFFLFLFFISFEKSSLRSFC